MKAHLARFNLVCAPLACAMLAAAASTHADSDRLLPRDTLPAYQTECAACHLAYPPGLLPAASWTRMMGSLDRHYGSDASLDPATVRQLTGWLQTHAGTYKRVSSEPPPDDRITRSAWFERKHRKIEASTWRLPSVKSAANCAACHTRADRGDYDDDSVQLPKGLSAWRR